MMRTMRDSGIEWIGEIPITWDARRTKELFGTLSGNGLSTDLQADDGIPFYKAGDISACDKFLEVAKSFVDFSIAEKRSFNIIPAMSIVFAKIGEAMKKNSRAITTIECCIDNNCQALIPKSIDLGFAYYLLLSIDMRWFDNAGTLPCVSVYKLMQSLMPYPPLAEQKKIADFLDGKCAEIDELVQTEEKMIEELKAYKQSVITEAVTKGLNPSAPMKDSGIEWIGKIPASWEVKKLKQFCDGALKYGANANGIAYRTDLARYVRITDILDNRLRDDILKQSLPNEIANDYILQDNDILFARSGGTVGKTFIFDASKYGKCAFAGYLIRARISAENIAKYVYYYTLSTCYNEWKNRIFIQSTIQNIGASKYSMLDITAPSLDEQKQIADYLDEECAKIDEIIALRNEQINQLKDYKKSLIYEYVTGKKEVV